MPVLDAVQRDLKEFPTDLAQSTLGATAEALAVELDDSSNSATSKSMCAKALADVMAQLRALAPPKREGDKLDDLAERRAARLAG